MKIRFTAWFWIGALLLLLYNHADFLYQAAIWKWPAWLDLSYRAPKWGFWDFMPHDGWHIVQFVKNHSMLIGAPGIFYGTRHPYSGPWIEFAVVVIVYSITRAMGFSAFLP